MRENSNGHKVIEVLVDPQATDLRDPGGFLLMLNFTNNGNNIHFEYLSTVNGMHYKEKNQFSKAVPSTSRLSPQITTQATTIATTALPITTEATTVATEEEKSGCGSAIGSTLMIACVTGTTLATFAMRKKKED
jgi:hypothetical protein